MLADLKDLFPWIVLLIVFLGEKFQQWFLSRALSDALHRAQIQPAPVAVSVQPASATPSPTKTPATPAAPHPTGPFADYPNWFQTALHEIGFHETGNNQGIERYIQMAHCGALGDAWCAIFANAMLEASGVPGTRSPSSRSFKAHPGFVQLSGPAKGAIVVFWRIAKASGQGHVGFYRGEDDSRIWTLGGNENDCVQIEALPKDSPTFGFLGYFWPKSVPLPTTGPVLMPTGSPVSVKVTPVNSSESTATARLGVQTGITATVFGGPTSAYGPPVSDTTPCVALPHHFPSPRPQVKVTNKSNGKSVVCDIGDIGPWNIEDEYWLTGSRPQAESGTDLGQVSSSPRHTNKAGIDLNIAAAQAIGVDGKAIVDWQFVDTPQSIPVVT